MSFCKRRVWQLVTYMFLHAGPSHLLFNMLALWMFGVELERMWGSEVLREVLLRLRASAPRLPRCCSAFLPFGFAAQLLPDPRRSAHRAPSTACSPPTRCTSRHGPIYMFLVFPVPARYFVMIMGGISLLFVDERRRRRRAHHAPGRPARRLSLPEGQRASTCCSEIQYRFLKWRINRMRRKFDVYSGGRANDVDRRVH